MFRLFRIFILLIILCISAFFFFDRSKRHITPCDQSVIDRAVAHTYENLDALEENRALVSAIDLNIELGFLPANKKVASIKNNLEVSYRKAKGCGVSKKLKKQSHESYQNSKTGFECEVDKHQAEAVRNYETLRISATYPRVEKRVYRQVRAQVRSASAQEDFDYKWSQDLAFRKSVMVAMYNMTLRREKYCKNPTLPVSQIIDPLPK